MMAKTASELHSYGHLLQIPPWLKNKGVGINEAVAEYLDQSSKERDPMQDDVVREHTMNVRFRQLEEPVFMKTW